MAEIKMNIINQNGSIGMDINIEKILPLLENLEITPSKDIQEFNHPNSYGYDQIKVNAIAGDTLNVTPTKESQEYNGLYEKVKVSKISDEYIIPTGTLNIEQNGVYNVKQYNEANVNIPSASISLQDKDITITENGKKTIIADIGYDGLNSVNVTTNVNSGGTKHDFVEVSEWDENGYATSVALSNITSVPNGAFSSYSATAPSLIGGNLQSVTFPEGITNIGDGSFANCSQLSLTNLPDTIKSIGNAAFSGCTNLALTKLPSELTSMQFYAFRDCTNLAITTIPSNVTFLTTNVFYRCTNLKKISMPNIQTITGSNSSNSSFWGCTNLKRIWIGSSITSTGLGRYCFTTAKNSIEKIYIDLPRATVEAFSNYQYAFMNDTNKKSLIICNDDTDFISLEEFDDEI